MARVRLKDVAARAKVDPSTASRVLSGRLDLVKDETAKRVIEASRALGYTPNAFARGLRTQRTGSIGVVLPEFSNPVYAAVIDGIEQRAAERGLSVVIDAIRPDKPADFARLVSENRVDGLLFSAASDRSIALDVLESTAVPYVLVNRSVPRRRHRWCSTRRRGSRRRSGAWSRPGTRGSPTSPARPSIDTARRRKAGYLKAMKAAQAAGRQAAGGGGVRAGDRAGCDRRAARRRSAADGDLRVDDQVGAGRAARAPRARRVPIPEAVSVIAMPDVWLAAYCWPPLTTVDMPLGVMGGRAVDLLAAMVAGERPERVVVTSPRPRIVMRELGRPGQSGLSPQAPSRAPASTSASEKPSSRSTPAVSLPSARTRRGGSCPASGSSAAPAPAS